ncbi:MAG: MTH1187 family thiamine-binding protein [Bacteroidales bacterium]
MSVLLEFAMFPTDKGKSVSEYVSKIIELIRDSNFPYQLTPMGTIVETETLTQALKIVEQSYKVLRPDCDRVYSSIKLDIKKNQTGMMEQKIKSIETKIGKVNTD